MSGSAHPPDIAFNAYPRAVVDHVLSEFEVGPGDLVVDAGCQLAVALGAAGALVLALDPFALPSKAIASCVTSADAPIHFAQGRAGDLPSILVRELGPNIHPRVVSFGSAFRFMDQRAALDACDRCGAEGVALVFGSAAPSPWRGLVADIIVAAAHDRITTRAGVKNEALPAFFSPSAFSHVSSWRTEIRLERTAAEIATLATFYAMRAGIIVNDAAYDGMVSTITKRLSTERGSAAFVEDVTYSVIAARRSHENRLSAHATTRGP